MLRLDRLKIRRGVWWATAHLEGANGQALRLGGISNAQATELLKAVSVAIAAARRRLFIAELSQQFPTKLNEVVHWVSDATKACRDEVKRRGWLSHEFKTQLSATTPIGLAELLAEPEIDLLLKAQPKETQDAVSVWRQPFAAFADALNRRHMAEELVASRLFFDSVEKSPLTREQAEAVICCDNRVLLVAAAGSGKTSTMVAKAGYALKNRHFEPEHMLLLAFNNDAAAELRERIKARLTPPRAAHRTDRRKNLSRLRPRCHRCRHRQAPLPRSMGRIWAQPGGAPGDGG